MHSRRGLSIAALMLTAGCAQLRGPSLEPDRYRQPIGPLDAAYDRSKWRWVKNLDGRMLLSHTEVPQCFIDPRPDQGFSDPGFSMKREEKTIGNARYEVVSVFEKQRVLGSDLPAERLENTAPWRLLRRRLPGRGRAHPTGIREDPGQVGREIGSGSSDEPQIVMLRTRASILSA